MGIEDRVRRLEEQYSCANKIMSNTNSEPQYIRLKDFPKDTVIKAVRFGAELKIFPDSADIDKLTDDELWASLVKGQEEILI